MVRHKITDVLRRFLDELDSSGLEVIKVPGRDGVGYVRAVCSRNPEWYREFCAWYVRPRRGRYRRPRTIIKRCWTRKGLLHLLAGNNSTMYSGRLMEYAEHAIARQEDQPW